MDFLMRQMVRAWKERSVAKPTQTAMPSNAKAIALMQQFI